MFCLNRSILLQRLICVFRKAGVDLLVLIAIFLRDFGYFSYLTHYFSPANIFLLFLMKSLGGLIGTFILLTEVILSLFYFG